MESVCGKCWGGMLVLIGLILVLVRLYTMWDIWVVMGVILIVGGFLLMANPTCSHVQAKPAAKKKK